MILCTKSYSFWWLHLEGSLLSPN